VWHVSIPPDEVPPQQYHFPAQMDVVLSKSEVSPPTAPQQLRVLTLNCCLLPPLLYQSPGADNREQRAQLIKRLVQRYDVVLLQEVFSCQWSSKWRDVLQQVPGMSSLTTVRGVGKVTDSGLVLLSRYPILEGRFLRFHSKGFTNAVVDRGFLYAAIQVGSKKIHLVDTHLNPNECHYGFLSAQEYRRRQLDEIQTFRAGSGDKDGRWIIGGDFNDSTTVSKLSPMNITFARDQVPTSHSLVPFAIADNGEHECIDYLASTLPFRYYRLMEALVSDHYGVEAMLTLS
jgi:endonuclease/exonuclease/phosphatase family metal-dependent hydrolase